MRIRKRPQSLSFQPSDPSTSTPLQPQPNATRNQECLVGEKQQEERLHPNADLGDNKSAVAKCPALPPLPPPPPTSVLQEKVVDSSKSLDAQQAATSHKSLENGHHHLDEEKSMTCTSIARKPKLRAEANEPVTGGAEVTVKEEKNDSNGSGGRIKKRRSPAVLMEGSRCSRVNGRGWRCSQPTLVGYSLCEHHLGKGRLRSVSGGRGGTGQLGRTEPRKLAAAVTAVTAAPKAEEPSLRHC